MLKVLNIVYFIQSYRASDYFEVIFGLKMELKPKDELNFDLEKETKLNLPKQLSSSTKDKKNNDLFEDFKEE